jgi:hypothetical protein
MNIIVIAANNREDLSWLDQLPNAYADHGWQKVIDTEYKPLGREAHSYLRYIIDHYLNLPEGQIVLCQGNAFDHDPQFLYHLLNTDCQYFGRIEECDSTGLPHCQFTPLESWLDVLGLSVLPDEHYKFVAGAQYRVTTEQIHLRPEAMYRALLELTKLPSNKAAWCCERIWPILWELNL